MAAGDAVLLSEPSPGVRLITLNRPRVRNAMTEEMTAAWTGVMASLAADRDVRVAVVTGAGSSFCSGGGPVLAGPGGLPRRHPRAAARADAAVLPHLAHPPWTCRFPVIAAVNGPVVGAGVCLALACDLRYASPGARFSTPFIYLGTHGGMAATWLLPEAIGGSRAREMLYTGLEVGAEQAQEWGLVGGVADDVLAHALKVAERVAGAAPIATKLTK